MSGVLASIDPDEYRSTLEDEMRRKNRTIKESNPYQRKAKLFRFAAGRGFENDLIYELINAITARDDRG